MLLSVNQLSKQYKRGNTHFFAVQNLSFSVAAGDFVNITGRSGSGKSTLLNMLTGLLKPTSGQIELNGTDLCALSDREMSQVRNQKIGYIPQGTAALANLSVLDNICLPFYLYGTNESAAGRALFLLEEVGLSALADMFPAQLSGGELRRALIARALMNEPELLIADEPTSDLNTETTHEIMALFAKINQGGTAVLSVTHELDTLRYGSRTVSMAEGRLNENSS